MDDLRAQLRDIRGLDAISWWPPAPGWWIVAGLIIALFVGLYLCRAYKRRKARSWQAQAEELFEALRKEPSAKKQAAALSELLKRLAMHKYGRESCAGLEGQVWLVWLSENDPKRFDWQAQGRVLIEAPYAPESHVAAGDMEAVIKAAERWVS